MSDKLLICLGYCSWDHVCVVPRIPIDDKVKIDERLECGGGPAATAATASARLGVRTAFIGSVGDDTTGNSIVAALEAEGIDASHVARRANSTTSIAYCWADAQTGGRSIAWAHGNCAPLAPTELDLDFIRSAAAIHLDGHQTPAAIAAAKAARAAGVHVSLDAGTMVDGIEELLQLSDVVIASEKFAKNYTKQDDPETACRLFFGIGNKIWTGVTSGARGSVGFDGTKFYHQPAFPIEVKDSTGAGDTYHGAFIASYIAGYGWQECMRRATGCSALKCTKLGGRAGQPTAQQLDDFLSKQ